MSDLISRQAAIDNLISFLQLDGEYAWGVRDCLNSLPSVQPDYDLSDYPDRLWNAAYERGKEEAEVKHGRWVKQFDENCWWTECSECGNYPLKSAYGYEQLSDFCPYCGADMRERSEDGN